LHSKQQTPKKEQQQKEEKMEQADTKQPPSPDVDNDNFTTNYDQNESNIVCDGVNVEVNNDSARHNIVTTKKTVHFGDVKLYQFKHCI